MNPTPWLTYGFPIFTAVLGACLTLFIQKRIERGRNQRDDMVAKRKLHAKAVAKIHYIGNILNELAMYRTHKQYYRRASEITNNRKEADNSHDKHYAKGQETREAESRFNVAVTEFVEILAEYSFLASNNMNIDFGVLTKFRFEKSSNFNQCDNLSGLVDALKQEESRLRNEYTKYVGLLNGLLNKVS